jgi:ribosomal protein S7
MQQKLSNKTASKKSVLKNSIHHKTKLQFSSYPTPVIKDNKAGKNSKSGKSTKTTALKALALRRSPLKTADCTKSACAKGQPSAETGVKAPNNPAQLWPMSIVKSYSSLQKSPKNIYQNWISWLVEKQSSFNHKKPDKLQKLVHHLIRQGKKTRALKLVRHSFHYLTVYKKNLQTNFLTQSKTKGACTEAQPKGLTKSACAKAQPKASSLTSSSMPGQKKGTGAFAQKQLSPRVLRYSTKGRVRLFDAATSPTVPSKGCALAQALLVQPKRLTAPPSGPSPFPKFKKSVTRYLTNYSKANKSTLRDSRFRAKSSKNLCASSLSIFRLALQKVRPFFHLSKARKAGVNIQVPAILPPQNQDSLAIQWLIEGAKARKKKDNRQSFAYHLAQEILVAAFRSKESYAFQKREEGAKQVQTHRNAARFRWW